MDWASLNDDMLRLITKNLGDISNVVRVRAVCRHWRWSIHPCDCPPQLPWFLEFQPEIKDATDINFFSLYSNKTHTLHIPEAKGKHLCGPSNKYFLMHEHECQNPSVSILDPLTRSHLSISQTKNFTIFYPIYIGPYYNHNPNPNENDDIAVVFLDKTYDKYPVVVFCRFGDTQLTKKIEVPCAASIAYFQRKLFVSMRKAAETRVFDVTTGDQVSVISSPFRSFHYLIEACGDLLGVVETYDLTTGELQFEVYRLENGAMNSHWVKMTNGIGDCILFLNGSRLGGGLCVKASDFEGFRGNCIYYAKLIDAGKWLYNLYRYDLKRKETEVIPHPSKFPGAWFVPSLISSRCLQTSVGSPSCFSLVSFFKGLCLGIGDS